MTELSLWWGTGSWVLSGGVNNAITGQLEESETCLASGSAKVAASGVACQMRTVLSNEPDAMHMPSGENTTEVTTSVCPW